MPLRRMRHRRLLKGLLILPISVGLALPAPALALRAGLEGREPEIAAGLEASEVTHGVVQLKVRWKLPATSSLRARLAETNQQYGTNLRPTDSLRATAVVFYEGREDYYLLAAAHVTNPLDVSYAEFLPSYQVVLSNGRTAPAALVGQVWGWMPDLAILRVRKSAVTGAAIAVVPLADRALVDAVCQGREQVTMIGYPAARWNWNAARRLLGLRSVTPALQTTRVTSRRESGVNFHGLGIKGDWVRVGGRVPTGFSGAPVLFRDRIVGLVIGSMSTRGGVFFSDAISAVTARQVLRALIEPSTRGGLDRYVDDADRAALSEAVGTGLEESANERPEGTRLLTVDDRADTHEIIQGELTVIPSGRVRTVGSSTCLLCAIYRPMQRGPVLLAHIGETNARVPESYERIIARLQAAGVNLSQVVVGLIGTSALTHEALAALPGALPGILANGPSLPLSAA